MSGQRVRSEWREGTVRVIVLAVWFGLFTGLAEVGLIAVKKLILHRIVHVSPHVTWMAPLADITLFVTAMLPLIVAGRWRPGLLRAAPAGGILAALSFLTLSLHYTPIHIAAKALLAAGVGVQVSRWIAAHPAGFSRLVQWTLGWPGKSARRARFSRATVGSAAAADAVAAEPALAPRAILAGAATVMVVLAGAVHLWSRLEERGALARLGSAAVGPNIVLIVWDTVRSKSLSLYGYDRATTPYLDELGAGSTVFDLALATAPWTLPTHASIFTGRWHHELSTDWEAPLDGTYPTLAEFLSGRGYATAGFVANTFYGSYEHGLDRGFTRYEDYRTSASEILTNSALGSLLGCRLRSERGCRWRHLIGWYDLPGRKTAAHINRSFLRWLDAQPPERPFFAFLNYFDAHAPYLPPAPYATRFGNGERGNPMQLDYDEWTWTKESARAEQDAYDGAIAYLDAELRRLVEALRERGLLEETIVILTSDHGEEFLEHGVMSHSNSLYVPGLHVPLVIHAPGRAPALRVAAPSSVRDLPATIMSMLGIAEHPFPGATLARHWQPGSDMEPRTDAIFAQVSGRTWRRAHYPVSKGDMASVFADGYHLIRSADGKEELYDLRVDPWETQEIPPSAARDQIIARLRGAGSGLSLDREGVTK